MWLGRHQLGNTIPLVLQTDDAAGTPTQPNDCPQVIVYTGTTEVLNTLMPIRTSEGLTSLFTYGLFLDSSYSTGPYTIEYRWVLPSAYIGVKSDEFEVIAGGHVDGCVTSMYFWERPHAKFIVHGTERGLLLPGKNPRL